MSANRLSKVSFRVGLWRLRRDTWFFVATVCSLAVASVLVALAGAWSLKISLFSVPYSEPQSLWFVQIARDGALYEAFGSELQASGRVAERFATEQTAFDGVTMAISGVREVVATEPDGGKRLTVPSLQVDRRFWTVLGVVPDQGRVPLADSAQAVVGKVLAEKLFGFAAAALGKRIQIAGAQLEIVGVLPANFVAPSMLSDQRRFDTPLGLILTQSSVFGEKVDANVDAAQPLLMIGRSTRPQGELFSETGLLVNKLAQAAGATDWVPRIRSLREHMLGDDAVGAARLLALAAVLALTTLAGISMLCLSRFGTRRGDHQIMEMIGALPNEVGRFEGTEAWIVGVASVVVAVPLSVLLLFALRLNPLTSGIVDFGYLLLVAVILMIMMMVSVAVVRLSAFMVLMGSSLAAMRNARGGARAALMVPMLRAIQGLQSIVVLLVVTLCGLLLGRALNALNGAFSMELDAVAQWRVEFPAGTPAELAAQDLARIQRSASQSPGVVRAAVSLLPALDLRPGLHPVSENHGVIYRGRREPASEVTITSDSSYILRYNDDKLLAAETIQYSMTTAAVDPEFLSVMGYRLVMGRIFSPGERNAVVLNQYAARILFGESQDVIGRAIPGPPWQAGGYWNNGLRVVGVVDAVAVTESADVRPTSATLEPIAFLPYQSTAWTDPNTVHSAYLIIKLADPDISLSFLDTILHQSDFAKIGGEVTRLDVEVWRRLREHLLATMAGLLVAGCALFAAAISASGTIRTLLEKRRAELGIRVAMGADEQNLLVWLFLRDMRLPAALAVTWVVLLWIADGLAGQLSLTSIAVLRPGIAAALILLGAAATGIWFGVRPILNRSVIEALRAE